MKCRSALWQGSNVGHATCHRNGRLRVLILASPELDGNLFGWLSWGSFHASRGWTFRASSWLFGEGVDASYFFSCIHDNHLFTWFRRGRFERSVFSSSFGEGLGESNLFISLSRR